MATAVNPEPAASISVESGLAQVARRLRRVTVQVRNRAGHGSGVIWRSDGLIVTNAHVAHGSGQSVVLWDGRSFKAPTIAHDRRRDLAAIRIAATGLDAAVTRDPGSLSTGEVVLALGHPMGDVGALATGIVHAPATGGWVQADIRLAPGNSGGPLADVHGRIVGINSMVVGGLAVAVASTAVEGFVTAPNSPQLGVTVQLAHTPAAGAIVPGLLVVEVEPNSAAHLAGVMVGDLIVAAGGVRLRNVGDLAQAVNTAASGGSLCLELVRAGVSTLCRVRFTLV